MPRAITSCLGSLCLAAGLAHAQAPYLGRWVQNFDRSDFAPFVVVYGVESQGFSATQDGSTYTFAIDGREYPGSSGNTVAWRKVNERTWQVLNRREGRLASTDTLHLSPDGRRLVLESHAVTANGRRSIDSTVFERSSAGAGFTGRWKAIRNTSTAPEVLEILSPARNAITLRNVNLDLSCAARLDGKDYPSVGPTQPAGFTCAISETGPRSLDVVIKKDGNVSVTLHFNVSADGKTLTESINDGRGPRVVFDRR
jgi:hypothetical protein